MEESKIVKGKFRQFRAHKNMNEGWRYFKIHGSDKIIATRINIIKAFQTVEKGGEPYIVPQNKQPSYEWELTNEIKTLSIEEYEAIQKSGWDD